MTASFRQSGTSWRWARDRIGSASAFPDRSRRDARGSRISTVDEDRLARGTGIARVRIINDFEAIGYAIPHLTAGDLVELQAGAPRADPPAPLAVIGPGTGLGQGFLVWDGARYRPYPSEGGHADFAPDGPVEYELHAALRAQHGHVSVERVVSGPGLVTIYRFLTARAGCSLHPEVQQALDGGDPAAAISRLGLSGADRVSADTLRLLVRALARQAGNFVLSLRATGGVYLAGGIAPQILPVLGDGTFVEAFRDKGRLRPLLAEVPIHVIVAEHAGLLGAAAAVD